MKFGTLMISMVALAIASCGKKEQEATRNNNTPPASLTPPPVDDNSAEQEELGEQALASIEKIGNALQQIKDDQSVEQAIDELNEISGELETISGQMKSAGAPSPELAARLSKRLTEIQQAQLPQIDQSMQALQAAPDTAVKINRALQALEDARSSKTFEAYGF